MRLLGLIRTFAKQWRSEGFFPMLRAVGERLNIRYQEWRLGIRSESVIELSTLGLADANRRPYVPTDYRTFPAVLDSLNIHAGRDVFVDFGSGLGRAVILAATRPFRRVIGVELSAELNRTAQENVENARRHLICSDVELVTADAATYRIPPEVSVIYFFNPFCGPILVQVLDNLRASLRENPRELRLLCRVPEQSTFEAEIRQQAGFILDREVRFDQGCRYLVFTIRP